MSLSASYNHNLDGSSKIFTNYNRAAEIEKHCSSHLPLASKLSPDDNRGIRIKSELSFTNGDWEQEDGHATLMSFEGHGFPTKLVTFKVMDISSVPHFENTVCLGGIMSIGISSEGPILPTSSSPPFTIRPGVYLQTNDHENGKEHLLCLLGNTTLPISKPFIDDWNDYYLEYSLLEDDHILLVLQYPQSSSLKRRAIRGEMQSLNQEGSLAYFDNVHISSQLNGYANFSPRRFTPFDILQNHKDKHDASKLGPFQLGKESDSAWNDGNYRMVFQNLICDEQTNDNNIESAKVSAVLRAFPTMDEFTE
ncbi:hypothetical protein Ahy_A01g000386 [Arachis hypogaea]|uniref:DUF2921 domain-containing protein n=1 Tax=Arachis hypogaea TaxID=3818 RepID=A0A445EK74_ARAHY|nr:hypothetical protein Ahy_A01g000386 [Arachis hypogaea]